MSRKRKNLPSPNQRRQRELAWAIFVSEGAVANMHKLLAVNCVTFDEGDKRVVNKAIEHMIIASEALRKRMAQIS